MEIQFAIHTYGHFDAMFYVLNGIKMIMASSFTESMIKLMALIATSYYALLGMAGAGEGRVGTYLLKTVGMLIVVTALLTPKADMMVIDRVSGKKELVRGLPYAFVLPVGTLEAIGAGITSLFEQAFATVSSTPYKDYGMIFGQRIVQEAKNWRIANPEFTRNMDAFLSRCVVLEAMIGSRFTPEDVKSTDDLFSLVTENAGTFRKVDFRVNKVPKKLTCKEAGQELKKYLKQEMGFLSFKYKNSDFGIAGGTGSSSLLTLPGSSTSLGLNQLLARNLEIGYKNSLGIDGKAEDIIRQNMMINSLKDFNNKSDLYAYTRASGIQNSNWFISGELAKEYLPLLLNIIKALIYASFIFIVPLMILGGGMSKYIKYCVVVFSLQIWPALNSVLNLFIELYSNLKGSGITGGDLTYGNFNQAYQAVDTIVLVASGLQMSIPFLSFAIVQGGVGSFIHLANSIQSASSGAASVAGNELASGSRSFDNITKGSQSIEQKSGFKTDWNQSYQEGATQVQGASGSMFRTFADGSSIISDGSGVNLSSGSRRFGLSGSIQASAQGSISSALTAASSAEQSFMDTVTSQTRSAASLITELAKRESAGESFDYKELGEKGQNLQQMVNSVKDHHDRTGDGYEQAAQSSINAYVDAGGKIPSFIPLIKGEAGIKAETGVTASNRSSQSLDTEEGIHRGNDTSKSFTNQEAATKNKQWMKDYGIDTKFAEDIQESFEQGKTYQQIANQKREEAESYREALEYSKNTGATDDRDMYHEVEQGIMKQYGVSQKEAHQMIETYDPRADKVWNHIVNRNIGDVMSQVDIGKNYVENVAIRDEHRFRNEHSDKVNDRGIKTLKETAKNQGLSEISLRDNITNTKTHLEDKHKNIIDENNIQHDSVLHTNEVLESNLEERAKGQKNNND